LLLSLNIYLSQNEVGHNPATFVRGIDPG